MKQFITLIKIPFGRLPWLRDALALTFAAAAAVLGAWLGSRPDDPDPLPPPRSFAQIDTLVALTDHSSISYFSYRGTLMGYHYELLSRFAHHLGVELRMSVRNDLEGWTSMLETGQADIAATNFTVTGERARRVAFARPFGQTRQVLVQRRQGDTVAVRSPGGLAGRAVFVERGSVFAGRLAQISDEIGQPIFVRDAQEATTEQLISMVAQGDIALAVADEIVARMNATYYDNLDVSVALSEPQDLSWAVARGADSLLAALDDWLAAFLPSATHAVIYNKYFASPRGAARAGSDFLSARAGALSPYDSAIRQAARLVPGWDWRLVASLVYQESRFETARSSWAGAFGLMQLMPATARRYGVDATSPPEAQIVAGCRFLAYLDNYFAARVPDPDERAKFVLASYNIGHGHVLDARRLAHKYGRDTARWDNHVDSFMLRKAEPHYYLDSLSRNGYCRGGEAFRYVREVWRRYQRYKELIPDSDSSAVAQ